MTAGELAHQQRGAHRTGGRLRSRWGDWATLGILAAGLGLGLTLAVWTDAFRALVPVLARDGAPLPFFVLTASGSIGAALLLGMFAYGESYLAALLATVPMVPTAIAVAVLLVYVSTPAGDPLHSQALYFGSAVALGTWVLSAPFLRWLAVVDTAQARSFGELVTRTEDLANRIEGAEGAAASPPRHEPSPADPDADRARVQREVVGYLDMLRSELGIVGPPGAGLRYAMGTGYANLWRSVHRAEELLLAVAPEPELLGAATYDLMRLTGAEITNRGDLSSRLAAAMAQFGAPAAPQLPPGVAPVDAPPAVRRAAIEVIQQIRHAINEFRDDRWEGLIRERNRLLRTIFLTTGATALFVVLAVVMRVDSKYVVAAAVFYLVGAIVGLFARLRSEGTSGAALDDYGLFEARLLHVPLLSGLAAVAGVFVFAVSPTILGTDAAAGQAAATRLADVFDLQQNMRGLIAAGVFGLTPELLLGWLRKQGEDLKSGLSSSQAAGAGGAGGVGGAWVWLPCPPGMSGMPEAPGPSGTPGAPPPPESGTP